MKKKRGNRCINKGVRCWIGLSLLRETVHSTGYIGFLNFFLSIFHDRTTLVSMKIAIIDNYKVLPNLRFVHHFVPVKFSKKTILKVRIVKSMLLFLMLNQWIRISVIKNRQYKLDLLLRYWKKKKLNKMFTLLEIGCEKILDLAKDHERETLEII